MTLLDFDGLFLCACLLNNDEGLSTGYILSRVLVYTGSSQYKSREWPAH